MPLQLPLEPTIDHPSPPSKLPKVLPALISLSLTLAPSPSCEHLGISHHRVSASDQCACCCSPWIAWIAEQEKKEIRHQVDLANLLASWPTPVDVSILLRLNHACLSNSFVRLQGFLQLALSPSDTHDTQFLFTYVLQPPIVKKQILLIALRVSTCSLLQGRLVARGLLAYSITNRLHLAHRHGFCTWPTCTADENGGDYDDFEGDPRWSRPSL